MKNLILINALLLLSISSFAQNYKFDWVRAFNSSYTSYNLQFKSITTDNESNVYFLTMLYDTVDVDPSSKLNYLLKVNSETYNGYLVKLDKYGNFIFAFIIDYLSSINKSIFVDQYQNIYISGNYLNEKGSFSGFVNKYDKNGNILLKKSFPNELYIIINSIIVDNEENIYLVGTKKLYDNQSNLQSREETFIKKLDKNGEQIWGANIGGNNDVKGKSICLDSKGNVFVGGTFVGEVDFDPRSGISKISSDNSAINGYILKLDPFGNFLWVNKIGSNDEVSLTKIINDKSDNIIISGSFKKNVYIDLNKNFTTNTLSDFYISSVTNDGKYRWLNSFGGNSEDNKIDICLNKNDEIIGFCNISENQFLNYKNGYLKINGNSFLLFKLNKNIDIEWGKIFPIYLGQGTTCLTVDYDNNIYAAADFFKILDFDPDNGPYILTTGTDPKTNWYKSSDFILKLKLQTTDNVDINNEISSFELFPNPTVSSLSVSKTTDFLNRKYSIHDVLGRRVLDGILENQDSLIDVNNLQNGTYFIKIEGFATQKFVKSD